MDFDDVERQYYELKGRLDAGTISPQEFDSRLRKLTMRDATGRTWMIGAQSGMWYYADGTRWVQANPPRPTGAPGLSQPEPLGVAGYPAPLGAPTVPTVSPTPPYAYPAAGRAGGDARIWFLGGFLLAVGVCLFAGALAVFLPQSPLRGLVSGSPPSPLETPVSPTLTTSPTPAASGPMRLACNHALGSGIYDRWVQLGAESGTFGCPTTDETEASISSQGTTGRMAEFSKLGGLIYWHRDGIYAGIAFEVHGSIGTLYKKLGGSASKLGFPIGNEFEVPTGRRSNFEGGYILWDAKTNTSQAYYNDGSTPPADTPAPLTATRLPATPTAAPTKTVAAQTVTVTRVPTTTVPSPTATSTLTPPTATPKPTATTNVPPALSPTLTNPHYERWGRPTDTAGCWNYNNASPVRRFTMELVVKNNTAATISNWVGPEFSANTGAGLSSCAYGYGGNASALPPIAAGAANTVTFFTFTEEGTWVSRVVFRYGGWTGVWTLGPDGEILSSP